MMEKMETKSLAELVTMIVTVRLDEARMMTQVTPIAAKTKPKQET